MTDIVFRIVGDAGGADKAFDRVGQAIDRVDQRSRSGVKAFQNLSAGADDLSKSADKAGHASSGMTREVIVLAHELSQGNYTRFGGSLLVLAEYSKTATAALSVLVGPIGVVAAIVGAFALAAYQGAKQSAEFARAVRLTGDYAGVTEGQFNALADTIAVKTVTSVGKARGALQALVESGNVGGQLLAPMAEAVVRFSKATGQAEDEVAKDFANMGDDVVKFVTEHNKQLNFVTLAQYEHIKALVETGQKQTAEIEVLGLLNQHLATHATFWQKLGLAVSQAWDEMAGNGRAETVEDKLAAVNKRLAQYSNLAGAPQSNAMAANDADEKLNLVRERTALLYQQAGAAQAAFYAAEEKRVQKAGVIADEHIVKLEKEMRGTTQLKLDVDALNKSFADRAAAGHPVPAEEQATLLAFINRRDQSKAQKRSLSDATVVGKEQFRAQIDQVQGFIGQEADLYRSREDALRRTRSADLIGDQQYLEGLNAAEGDYLASLAKAQADEEAIIARRKAKADPRERAELDRTLAESRIKYANTVRDTSAQVASAYLQADEAAAAWARSQQQTNQRLTVDLIADSQARARALAGLDIQEKQRQVSLLIEGTDARKHAETELAEFVVLRNRQLTEELKPEWQRMLEGWQDTNRHMRESSDEFMSGFLTQGRDVFVQFAKTGKFNVGGLFDFIRTKFLEMTYEQYLSKSVSSLGQGIFSSLSGGLSGLFGGGLSIDTGGLGITAPGGALADFGLGGGRASGGPVSPYKTYLVGEAGPELLRMGSQSGSVVPNHALGGGDIHLTLAPVFQGNGITRTELVNGMALAAQTAVAQVAELRRRGNSRYA